MKADLLDGVRLRVTPDGDDEPLVAHEWLVTNGLGGYASASVASLATRKYHGLLVAALPNPLGRIAMLNHVVETVVLGDGRRVQLSGDQRRGQKVMLPGIRHLRSFRLDAGLPVWEFDLGKAVLERRVVMPHRQNTTYLIYRLVGGEGPVRLELRPGVHFRNYEQDVGTPMQLDYALERTNAGAPGEDVYALTCTDAPATLRLQLTGSRATYHPDVREITELHYRVEEDRGYAFEGRLWTPGVFSVDVGHGATSTLVASAESAETMLAMTGDDVLAAEMERRRRLLRTAPTVVRADAATAELVLAADQFLITPAGRRRDAARAIAEGDEIRSVIAGYHWFTDWGRDTMISLEGLTLSTGRVREAGSILRTFAHYVRDGLLPNMFPDGSNEGLYHTADATLWFYHAVDRYLTLSGDEVMLERLLPTMIDIAEHHLRGTRFGIGVDSADGLVRQGAEGYQLTWMDAKVDGWVVTPRRGKAVEINALWYNALCVLGRWVSRVHGDEAARPWGEHAARARASFNERFWYGEGGYLYDVIDGPNGDSIECRPNQLFAISLPNPVLDRPRWESVMRVIEERLVTPVGLRSLAPGSPNYAPRYFGNLRARDAAYHQGTVWGWLIGPWIDAWRKLHPGDPAGARRWLDPLIAHLGEFGVGSIAEIFDAEPPYTPRGCIAQAWSVAEVLRQMVAAGQTREMQLTAEEPT